MFIVFVVNQLLTREENACQPAASHVLSAPRGIIALARAGNSQVPIDCSSQFMTVSQSGRVIRESREVFVSSNEYRSTGDPQLTFK